MKNSMNNYANELYVIAVSTGVDSMVLLDLAVENKLNIVVAHVNHNKREQSNIEENFIKEYCLKNNIKLEILQYTHEKDNFQNEARNARYNFFYNVAIKHNAKKILTAHHSYDNVETILINILRGSNLKGYAGITNTTYNDIIIQRPLIQFNKNEIYNYANNNNIRYFEDDSNNDSTYLRNNIRNNVLNNLQNINEDFEKKFTQYSELLLESYDFIRSTSISNIINNKVNINTYKNLHKCIQKDILNYLFEQNNLTSSKTKINDCINLLLNNNVNVSYDINKGYKLIKEYEYFYLSNKISNKIHKTMCLNEKCEIPMYGTFYLSNIIPKTYTDILKICYNEEEFPITIRNKENGDKIQIKNGHKKVSDLFTDNKVPKEQRENILLIENNNKEILWVMNHYKKDINKDYIYLVFEGEKYE